MVALPIIATNVESVLAMQAYVIRTTTTIKSCVTRSTASRLLGQGGFDLLGDAGDELEESL